MDIEKGIISKWNEEKSFGFITPASGGGTIFFHINDYSHRHKRPLANLKVQYCTSTDPKGRICAVGVTPSKGHRLNSREFRQKIFSIVLFAAFSFVLFRIFESNLIRFEIICLYGIMSIVTFLMYAKDKNAAEWGKWRTTEGTLHALSLLGGWPGAKIAQSFLRHKSKKLSFRMIYWLTVAANCGALYWLLTPKGSQWLKITLQNINLG